MSEILEKVGLKTCSKCEQTLPVSAFGKNKYYKDGLNNACKPCKRKALNEWRDKNRDYVNEQGRQWYVENSEQVIERVRQYCQDPENNRKQQVKNATNYAIARGKLIRPDTCSQCGDNTHVIQAHHWSYEVGDELDVIWLCPKCHTALHRRNRID